MKNRALLIGAAVLGVCLVVLFSYRNMLLNSPHAAVVVSDPILAYDASNPRAAAGFFTDIFTGRVVETLGTDKQDGRVMTRYSVEVFHVLKGDSRGTITVRQEGGYYDGAWTIINGDVGKHADKPDADLLAGYLFEPGKTYLFMTRHSPGSSTYTVSSVRSLRPLLDIDASVSSEEANQISANDPRVKAMEDAVANQIESKQGVK